MRKVLGVLGGLVVIALATIAIGLGVLAYNKGVFAEYWQGRANQPGDFIYVAVGDSTAQGLGASKPENGYVNLLAEQIGRSTGRQVRVLNLSQSGATVHDTVRKQVPQLRELEADLVTVAIGANDMHNYNPARFRHDYELLLQALPPGRAVTANVPYFGYRPPDYNRHARDANRTIAGLAGRYRVPLADLYGYLQSRQSPWMYASDLFHPNNRGYQLWDQAIWPVVEKRLPPANGLAETSRL